MTYSNIRSAIKEELAKLASEQKRLEAILKALDGTPTAEPSERPRRGKVAAKAVAGSKDIAQALELIKAADKKGVNVVRMSHVLRGAGYAMPSKAQLLEVSGVKIIGKGGGSAYAFTG